jgi:hypothetical protein
MTEELQSRASARLEEALSGASMQDPRGAFRGVLRALREARPGAFEEAIRYYDEVVVQRVAVEGADPLDEWVRYGCRIAELCGAGRFLAVDGTGESQTLQPPDGRPEDDAVILFVPEDVSAPVLPLVVPIHPSAAQGATLDLLVYGRLSG